MRARIIPTAVLVSLSLLGNAEEREKKIRRADLPPAVEQTVAAQSHGAAIQGFSQERENGEMFYEAELTVNGHSKDILIDANGMIAEIEEQVDFESLPGAVKQGLQAKAGKRQIVKVESLTKRGKLVAYEAKVHGAGKTSEIQVGPDGKNLDHEE